MKLFNNAPGVEWSPNGSEETAPMRPARPSDAPFPLTCPACDSELGVDGYCLQCGQKAKSLRDHFELNPTQWLSGVCDIGLAHVRNEDGIACMADGNRAVIVVCDGVTTSQDSDVASLAAARTACDLLWMNNPQGTGTATSRTAAIRAVLTHAVQAANQAVIETADSLTPNSAATTIVIAVVDDKQIHCANLGDSRAYWLPDDDEPLQISKDHSLAQDGIDSGAKRSEAESATYAHTITRWLGFDAIDLTPHLTNMDLTQDGWLVVCSDGLWNYASEASAIAGLVERFAANNASAAEVALGLVAWANEQGGHDNVTVACARLAVTASASAGESLSSTDLSSPGEPDTSSNEAELIS